MFSETSISISQHADVPAFVSEQIVSGASLGVIFPRLPLVEQAIDDLTLALGHHVLQLIPSLKRPAPHDKWLENAYALIDARRPPLPAGYPAEMNVDKLIRWVHPKCDCVLIGVIPQLDDAGQRDILTVAGWMKGASRLPVEVVHGMPLQSHPKRNKSRSKPEQVLWQHLQKESELSGLFQQNEIVHTVFQTSPRVDFLWRDGRLIVEIDGYYHHSHQEQFANDRQRDYETGVSGYLTLRLTDEEILSDARLAIRKIQRYVQIRKRIFYV
jgi:very-short-patch-repair endonuclease